MRTILVSAYGCEPGLGSEQGVGWNWVLQMAKNNNVHVITRANNRKNIERHIPKEVVGNITFHYYDTSSLFRRLKKRAKGLYLYYFFWQIGIIYLAKAIIKKYNPDYTIHLTFGSMWMPTFLHYFKTPFIWGPIGGGDCEPTSFVNSLPLRQRIQAYIRVLMNKTIPINPFIMLVCLRSRAVLCRTKSSGAVLPKRFDHKKHIILETAIDHIITNDEIRNDKRSIHLISTGRLVPSKNIITAIRALGEIPCDKLDIKYTIIGSGSEQCKIRQEIQKLNLQHRICLIPEMPRQEIFKKLAKADIFVFPSLREGGSWALMEGMAAGLPVICLKWSGMEVITDDSCAIRLPVTNPRQMTKDMAKAIRTLIDSPSLRKKMGEYSNERIRKDFNWDSKGRFMEDLFKKLDNELIGC